MSSKTITISFADNYLQVLERWASVSRTLNTAKQACEDAGTAMSEADVEKFDFCSKELEDLIPALDHMHKQIQQQLWVTKLNMSDMVIETTDGGPQDLKTCRWHAIVNQYGLKYMGYGETSEDAVFDLKDILAKAFPEKHWYMNLPVIQVD